MQRTADGILLSDTMFGTPAPGTGNAGQLCPAVVAEREKSEM
jgi:hypothetical protein